MKTSKGSTTKKSGCAGQASPGAAARSERLTTTGDSDAVAVGAAYSSPSRVGGGREVWRKGSDFKTRLAGEGRRERGARTRGLELHRERVGLAPGFESDDIVVGGAFQDLGHAAGAAQIAPPVQGRPNHTRSEKKNRRFCFPFSQRNSCGWLVCWPDFTATECTALRRVGLFPPLGSPCSPGVSQTDQLLVGHAALGCVGANSRHSVRQNGLWM